ncbi:MAG TPA: hypothetical protein CFH81_00455 [Sulfurovum sp. UBA12169]|nr:MAG TPA: hypothetical protein CFH81_00455 [Sulfurovum sp. UBA12169]
MAETKTLEALEKEVAELEEAAQRKALEKRLEQLKRADSNILSNGKTAKMRKPTVRDMKLSNEGNTDAGKELILMRNLTELTEEELYALDIEDYAIYQMMLQGFLS